MTHPGLGWKRLLRQHSRSYIPHMHDSTSERIGAVQSRIFRKLQVTVNQSCSTKNAVLTKGLIGPGSARHSMLYAPEASYHSLEALDA